MTFDYKYTGKLEYQPKTDPKNSRLNGQLFPYYLPENDPLIDAVNMAICLERPLLLQGEPGCGKTLLASAVAQEFKTRLNLKKNYPFFPWYIKSTTRAKDGLYFYDSIARLRDAQLVNSDALNAEEKTALIASFKDPQKYVNYGELGKAFLEEKHRPIILIDEIDKADIDFPNDLLRELDQGKFTIVETGTEVTAKQAPIVFITSNQEKELPDAFLRRCLYYYIEFPSYEQLVKIAQVHFPDTVVLDLIEAAVDKFLEVREDGVKRKDSKKPSTSELLDWLRWLQRYDLEEALDIIDSLADHPALLGTLLKTKEDQDYYRGRE